jgi:D-arabinose 1-dehydrogenase-like Zn-dependent alcohol dehydrogenase
VQFTTSEKKVDDALKLGADEFVVTKDASAIAKYAGSFDFILDCVSAPHDMNQYLSLLAAEWDVVFGWASRGSGFGCSVWDGGEQAFRCRGQ